LIPPAAAAAPEAEQLGLQTPVVLQRASEMFHDQRVMCVTVTPLPCNAAAASNKHLHFISVLQRQQRLKLSNWDCEYQLFRKELEDADDLRLSVRMFHACLADKRQFCDDVPAGGQK
jgi:hypothetical protein